MATDNRVRLAGALGSPYTQKMVALLRYRRLPYDVTWGDPGAACDTLGVARPSPVFMPTFFFANDAGELQAVCDSTPIIRRLEDMSSGRSVLPADPALAFIDYLLEDFADEPAMEEEEDTFESLLDAARSVEVAEEGSVAARAGPQGDGEGVAHDERRQLDRRAWLERGEAAEASAVGADRGARARDARGAADGVGEVTVEGVVAEQIG